MKAYRCDRCGDFYEGSPYIVHIPEAWLPHHKQSRTHMLAGTTIGATGTTTRSTAAVELCRPCDTFIADSYRHFKKAAS